MTNIKVVNHKLKKESKNITYKIDFNATGKQVNVCRKTSDICKEVNESNVNINIDTEELQTRKINNNTINKPLECDDKLGDMFSKAFHDMEDEYLDIDCVYSDNIESNLEKKIKQINNQCVSNRNETIKQKNISEIISLMKSKNILLSNENDQRNQLLKMNDSEIEEFKDKIVRAKHIELSSSEIEAAKMLDRIKHGGAIIGDFSKHNLKDSGSSENYTPREMSNSQFDMKKTANNQSENNGLNFENFQNLQGIKKPIQVSNKQSSMREDLVTAISGLDWTTLSK